LIRCPTIQKKGAKTCSYWFFLLEWNTHQLFSHYDKKCSVFHQTYMAFGLKFWERSDQNFNPNALWHEIDNAKHYQLSNTLPASSLFEFLESTETILTVKSLYRVISWLLYCT
jgi:hypothetical protein